ncbi:MAG: SHOCT domain-containing protein [Propionibacteriaceae bacterium]|jgi:hypothetical protein|nr:SHOCT domain-containing protein [Propionibacteriaceae bacterium]
MEAMRVQGSGGWVEYDGAQVVIVRDGVWNTLTGMRGERTLRLHEVSGIRFRRAKRGHGSGFIQFLRVDDPLGPAQSKMLGVYGRKDDIASAQLDEYAMMFNFRQHTAFVALKDAIERDLGQTPSPIEEPTVGVKPELWRKGQPPVDFAAVGSAAPEDDSAPLAETIRPAKALRPVRSERPMQPGPRATWRPRLVEDPAVADVVADLPPSEPPVRPAQDTDSVIAAIAKLAELRDQGILTESEFSDKKAELLRRL